jgi:hypothetical protein
MLARLDEQQQLVMRRAAEAAMNSVPLIQSQSTVLTQVRETRFSAMKELCGQMKLPETATFRELVPQLPNDYQPLVEALVRKQRTSPTDSPAGAPESHPADAHD